MIESLESLAFKLGEDTNASFSAFFLHSAFLATCGFVLGWGIEKISVLIQGQLSFRPLFITGLLQVILNILALYALTQVAPSFSKEWQATYSGLVFVLLLFGMQRGLVTRLYN